MATAVLSDRVLPENVERQLLVLDRQVRDATFSRGISRVGVFIPVLIGICLAVDWSLGLSGGIRLVMLAASLLLSAYAVWSWILRPAWRPASFTELAALVERQHPELKERLTTLVELQHHDAPGASPLMQDLLARQTAKAIDKLDLSDAAPAIRSPRTAMLAVVACLLLFAPFAFRSDEYRLLWARLFAPWGNFHWGATELVIVGGNRVVAKGSDAPIDVELKVPAVRTSVSPDQTIVWLHWTDVTGVRDSRRMDWDAENHRFATTLPHVAKALDFYAVTNDAKSETHRIDVANPPVITRLQLDIEPPAYTGLPARALDGAQGEIHAAERSRVVMKLEFDEPVAAAELVWPILPEDVGVGEKPVTERMITARLSDDKRSATVEALAVSSGAFRLNLKNGFGLKNEEPARSIIVDPDLPPAISLNGDEQPVSVRPNDRHLVTAQVRDDYGLTIVELHLESSEGKKRIDTVPVDVVRNRAFEHEFSIDVADFEVKPGQAITYRIRAVDNRPIPGPQETWTKPRTLMIDLKSQTAPEKELAQQEQSLKDEISELRQDIAENREALERLHRQTEDESLKGKNSDKSEALAKLQKEQAELNERLQKLAAELADSPLTGKLAEQVQKLAEQELAEAQQRLEQAKQGESRDQLQPLSEAIDRLGAIDRTLKGLDQQLAELGRLQQDLAQLEQLARNTDRLAEKLDQLEKQTRDAELEAKTDVPDAQSPKKPNDQVASNDSSQAKANPQAEAQPKTDGKNGDNAATSEKTDQSTNDPAAKAEQLAAAEAERKALQAESQKLNDEFEQLLKKHPELLDAARRDQLQRLEKLAEQAAQLAKPQEQLAAAFEKAADDPAQLNKNESPETSAGQPKSPEGANPQGTPEQPSPMNAGAEGVKEQRKLAQEATRQAQELAQREGAESPATQAAVEFAKRAIDAARKAETGNLDQAAEQGQAAAESARKAANELAPEGQPSTKQSEQATQLADRQEKLADELGQISKDKQAQQGARQQGQQQLADATEALSKRLDQTAKNLEAAPLDSKAGAQAAQKAQQAAKQATEAMKQALEASQGNDSQAAQEKASAAAEKLKEAASEAQNAPETPKGGESVPEQLGTNVAQAAQQLRKAQEQLEALSKPKEESQPTPGQPTPGQPGQGQPSELAQSADQYRKAAAAMRMAIQSAQGDGNGKPGMGQEPTAKGKGSKMPGQGKPDNQPGEPDGKGPGESGQPSGDSLEANQPNKSGEPGSGGSAGGNGALTDADLKQLDADLKKQGQRNWGRLPGQLKTEILQGATKKPRPEYAKQIKSYFEEISKPAIKETAP